MFFDKRNKKIANERTIYQARPNMVIGCKKAIYGVILLIILFYISTPIKTLIADMQMYMISYIKLGLTGYAMLAIVLIMLIDLMYIIWQLLSWYSTSYTITNQRIIAKKGVLNSKKTYMPFKSIQDIDLSQNILEKLLNIGTVTVYSAYDNNSMNLANISNPSEVESVIFDQMHQDIIPEHNRRYDDEIYVDRKVRHNRIYKDDFREYSDNFNDDDYYFEEYEPQLNKSFEPDYLHQRNQRSYNKYEYEEYPNYRRNQKNHQKYEYEYYDDNLEDNLNYAMSDIDSKYSPKNNYEENSEPYYNDYDYDSMEEFYENNKDEINIPQEEKSQKTNDTNEKIVQRHFEKFNR